MIAYLKLGMVKTDTIKIIKEFVDYLLPELTPYEVSLYIYLLRKSFFENENSEVRIGKRTISSSYGKGSRGECPSYAQISKIINSLEKKGALKIGDVNREGTLYTILLPKQIPLVKEKMAIKKKTKEIDYFTDLKKRQELFERDNWTCYYCGEKVTKDNATLDHLTPQCKGGKNTKENLKTSCLLCNSIKSGKTYEEASPYLLKSISERRKKK